MGWPIDKPRRAVTACSTVDQVWTKLKELYASSTVTMQNTLKDEWESLVQGPSQIVQEFIQAIDYLAMSLEASTIPQDDQSKYHRLMKGLGAQWSAQKEILDTTRSNYQDACLILIELGEKRGERPDGQLVPAYAVTSLPIRQHHQHGHERKFARNGATTMCFTCGAKDHTQDSCPTGLLPSYDTFGNQIDRCFHCLEEGHRSRQCPNRKPCQISKPPTK